MSFAAPEDSMKLECLYDHHQLRTSGGARNEVSSTKKFTSKL